MCGRFSLAYDKETVIEYLIRSFDVDAFDYHVPRYNIAPGQDIPAVIHDGRSFRAGGIMWGFKPAFAARRSKSLTLVNIRSESLGKKPMFDRPLRHGRCLIPADGFYEWNNKVPYRITLDDARFFLIPGLWTSHKDKDGTVHTAAVITRQARGAMWDIHHRMPVMLSPSEGKRWLKGSSADGAFFPPGDDDGRRVSITQVSTHVNSPKHDDSRCIRPVEG